MHYNRAMVTPEDIGEPRENIAGFVHRTPLLFSRLLSSLVGGGVYFKAECVQETGSFKARGATNKIKPLIVQDISGVPTASSGNHGQATAYVAGRVIIPAVIMVPEGAPDAKIDAARSYGAEVL
jgi:threonine dehydratase